MSKKALYWGLLFVLIVSGVGISPTFLHSAEGLPTKKLRPPCSVFSAVYKPANAKLNDKFYYEMRVVSNKEENLSIHRDAFYLFYMIDQKTNNIVSSLRLGNSCSPNYNECWASAYYGQYADVDSPDWKEFETPLVFDVVSFSYDYFDNGDYLKEADPAPSAFIFPGVTTKFKKNQAFRLNWDSYMKFKTLDKHVLDFSGMESWIFSYCENDQ